MSSLTRRRRARSGRGAQLGAEFRLFFAVYGHALQAPEKFAGFLERVVADWMGALCDAQGPGVDPAAAARAATLVIATIRGLLLDLLATGDQARDRTASASSNHSRTEHRARLVVFPPRSS